MKQVCLWFLFHLSCIEAQLPAHLSSLRRIIEFCNVMDGPYYCRITTDSVELTEIPENEESATETVQELKEMIREGQNVVQISLYSDVDDGTVTNDDTCDQCTNSTHCSAQVQERPGLFEIMSAEISRLQRLQSAFFESREAMDYDTA
jgi:hypothetical protein